MCIVLYIAFNHVFGKGAPVDIEYGDVKYRVAIIAVLFDQVFLQTDR